MKSVKTVVLWLKKNSAKVVISEDCTAGRQSVESDSHRQRVRIILPKLVEHKESLSMMRSIICLSSEVGETHKVVESTNAARDCVR